MLNQVSRTLKLINEIPNYLGRSKLRSTLENFWALLSVWLMAAVDKIPSARVRRAISTTYMIIIIVIVIAVGAGIIVLLIITPSGTTTTTVYP